MGKLFEFIANRRKPEVVTIGNLELKVGNYEDVQRGCEAAVIMIENLEEALRVNDPTLGGIIDVSTVLHSYLNHPANARYFVQQRGADKTKAAQLGDVLGYIKQNRLKLIGAAAVPGFLLSMPAFAQTNSGDKGWTSDMYFQVAADGSPLNTQELAEVQALRDKLKPSDEDNAPNPDDLEIYKKIDHIKQIAALNGTTQVPIATNEQSQNPTTQADQTQPVDTTVETTTPVQTSTESTTITSQGLGSSYAPATTDTPPAVANLVNISNPGISIDETTPKADQNNDPSRQNLIDDKAKEIADAIKSGDQERIKDALSPTQELGMVGNILAALNGLDGVVSTEPEVPATDSNESEPSVEPSEKITKATLEDIYKRGGNKAEQQARISIINAAIKLSRKSPVARNNPVKPVDAFLEALNESGFDETKTGFGADRYDCRMFVEVVFDVAGVDESFAGGDTDTRGYMNTTTLRKHILKTGNAGGKVHYKTERLSGVNTKDLIPGSVIVGSGHILIWLGGVEGANDEIYVIAEAARGSMRVPSLRTISDLKWVRDNLSDAIVVNISIPEKYDEDKPKELNKEAENIVSGDADLDPLLDLIAEHESGGNYNAYFRKANNTKIKFTNMEIDDVIAWQRNYVKNGSPSSAIGKYQFLSNTLEGLARQIGLDFNTKFTPAVQDKLAVVLLDQAGLQKYRKGDLSKEKFAHNIAKIWASLPSVTGPHPNSSVYGGDGLNRSLTDPATVLEAIKAIEVDG